MQPVSKNWKTAGPLFPGLGKFSREFFRGSEKCDGFFPGLGKTPKETT
jgi:hypothetical protein